MAGNEKMSSIDYDRIILQVKKRTMRNNIDNISRTLAYLKFYRSHPEICWALLASIVSRNAGWNMTDLESNWYKQIINKNDRRKFFHTYERANWLIFADAYPQLLIYEQSKKRNQPLFHLLKAFHVSQFMIREWRDFYRKGEKERLTTALIINEQHVIQKPVIEHPFFSANVFQTKLYRFQELLHFSYVLMPTFAGNLYGLSVTDFTDVKRRITLGKQLSQLLFRSEHAASIQKFARQAMVTGSRIDYEKYLSWKIAKKNPLLRSTFPIIKHSRHFFDDWSLHIKDTDPFFEQVELPKDVERTKWYKKKITELYYMMKIEKFFVETKKELFQQK